MGKTLGLVGAGNIGTEVARRAICFGMRAIAYDPLLKHHELIDLVPLETVFAESDYISLHVPLTPETEGMINSRSIAGMKDGVVIVNTARGKCIVEDEVVAALRSGKMRAYATDVFRSDPPDASCPLYDAPNVIMTPHLGASTAENMLRIGDIIVRILEDFMQHTA
jgi:D-3-phosphoglycerate dehydrogenase